MAFTIKKEYERLIKIKTEQEKKNKYLSFECGCVCGIITRIDLREPEKSKWLIDKDGYMILVYGIAGFSNKEELLLVIREEDVSKQYKNRNYYYHKQYGILEKFN